MSQIDVPGEYDTLVKYEQLQWEDTKDLDWVPKVLGGASAVNAGLYFIPRSEDFDNYFPSGWHWIDVKPYFDKLFENGVVDVAFPSANGKPYAQEGWNVLSKALAENSDWYCVPTEDGVNGNQWRDRKTKVGG